MMETIKLSNGVEMPLEGFGVFQVPDPKECEDTVYNAIKVGFRLIDTAALYMNEGAVGAAIKRAIDDGLATREELFVTTKLWCDAASYEGAKKAFADSMELLGLDYLDLYLIHQPYGDVYGAWKAMVELLSEGKVRAIGVANFYPGKFTEFAEIVDIKPMVNQIELHPFYAQYGAIENMKAYGCQPQAWGPLARGEVRHDDALKLGELGEVLARLVPHALEAKVVFEEVHEASVVVPTFVHGNREGHECRRVRVYRL
jgi:diketogulonate reductase-like aldo/keto reductase